MYERGWPLNAAMAAAAPPIAVCCGLVRPSTAGVPCQAGAAAAQPSWRAAVSWDRAAARVTFVHVAI